MNFYNLDFGIPLLLDSIDPFSLPKVKHTQLDFNYIDPRIVESFSKLSLNIVLAEVFYSWPNLTSLIHTDSIGGDINKINWIYGGTDCSMNWYSVKNFVKEKDIEKTPINTRYIKYQPNEVDIIESTVLKSPSIVNVGIPHNIKNKNEHRWCISLIYNFKESGRRPTMEESLKLFKDYIY